MTAYIKNESDLPQPQDYDPLMHRRDTFLDELDRIVREMEIALGRLTERYRRCNVETDQPG